MQDIRDLNSNTASYSKRLIAVAFVTASAISIVLIFGFVNRVFADMLKPFILISQSERRGETIDTSVFQNSDTRQVSQNQLGELSDEENKAKANENSSNQVAGDRGDYTKWSLPKDAKVRFGKGRIKQIEYSPDNNQLAVATHIGIWLYDAQSGKELNLLTGHSSEVNFVAYSPDGSTIATGSWDEVKLWDAVTGNLKANLKMTSVRAMAFSPDGTTIVTGTNHGPVQVWDVSTGQRKTEYIGHTDIVSSIGFSPDKTTIATASRDTTVRLWDISTGQTKSILSGHTEWVNSVAYSPDGTTIATASLDDTVRLWDAFSGNHIDTLTGHEHYALSVEYSPNGNTIVSRGWDGVIFWHVDDENDAVIMKGRIPKVTSPTYSSDGTTIAVGGYDGTVYQYDAADIETNSKLDPSTEAKSLLSGHQKWATCLTYSLDGTIIVTGNEDGVHLWDATTGQHNATYKGHTSIVSSVVLSPDGTTIVGGSVDRKVHFWKAETGQYKRHRIENHIHSSIHANRPKKSRLEFVTSAIYSPDGTIIASAINEYAIHLWNASTGQHINSCIGHTDFIHSIAFSPDGNTIASASSDKTVRLWDVETGKQKSKLVGHTDKVYSVAFSPDGKTIATGAWYGDSRVRLWDATTGSPKTVLGNHVLVLAIAYSPDGSTLATSSSKDLRLWNTSTGLLKNTFTGHTGRIDSITFSPDGNTIATNSRMDGTMILWDVTPK